MEEFNGTGDYITVSDGSDCDWPKQRWWMRGPFTNWNDFHADWSVFNGKLSPMVWTWHNPIRQWIANLRIRLSPIGVFNDMGSPDFRETYLYTIKELKRLKLAYVHIMDGLAFGFHHQGEPMTLAEFRAEYDGIVMGNFGYTKETAAERIAAGHADLAAFGRPFITNPDLPERFKNNWPLNPADDMSLWYTTGAEGYTDYKPYR